jgi:formamidopyrimidine-DNA glycosylase
MIKGALMDQKFLAGIGNVYADEILFQARLHPRTAVGDLSGEDLGRLFGVLETVLGTAIAARADPAQLPEGYLTPRRGKAGKCPRCGGALEKIAVAGRRGYVCPQCQTGS